MEGQRRYILCFNPVLFKDQRKARKHAITMFQSFVETLNEELGQAKRSRQRKAMYKKFKDKLIKAKIDSFVDIKLRVYHLKKSTSGSIRTYRNVAPSPNVRPVNRATDLVGRCILTSFGNHLRRNIHAATPKSNGNYSTSQIAEDAMKLLAWLLPLQCFRGGKRSKNAHSYRKMQ